LMSHCSLFLRHQSRKLSTNLLTIQGTNFWMKTLDVEYLRNFSFFPTRHFFTSLFLFSSSFSVCISFSSFFVSFGVCFLVFFFLF
jgi:hypothetical protein